MGSGTESDGLGQEMGGQAAKDELEMLVGLIRSNANEVDKQQAAYRQPVPEDHLINRRLSHH